MRWILGLVLVLAQVFSAHAQSADQNAEADKGYIANYLEAALSSVGSKVTISGFEGALSARATMEKLTIADDKGVWLTLTDAVLDWNRAAVFQGSIEINELSAASVELARLPVAAKSTASPEARSFTVPELPVSVRIGAVSVKKVVVGEPVVGVPVTASLTGAMTIVAGEGAAELLVKRQGKTAGEFRLKAGFTNASRVLLLDMVLREAADGIVANLLGLPGKPAVELSAKGEDVIDRFAANVILETDGQQRLAGHVRTQVKPQTLDGVRDDTRPSRTIEADIKGDLTPLFAPQYRDFLGSDVALKSRLSLFENGRKTLDDLTLTAAALRLSGDVALAADGLPESFQLDAVLQDPAGGAAVLPISGVETRVKGAQMRARFDRKAGEAWFFTSELQGLERADVSLDAAQIEASGVIARGVLRRVTARIDGTAQGIEFADKALAQAAGNEAILGADLAWQDGEPLAVSNLEISASGLALTGRGTVDGLESGMMLKGVLQAKAASLKRFSALAGQPLGGAMIANIEGSYALLSGEADLDFEANATDLSIGNAQLERLLKGDSRVTASILRTTQGLTLRSSSIVARGGTAHAEGRLATDTSRVTFDATLNNTAQFVQGLNGPAKLTGTATQSQAGWLVDVDANGPRAITLAAAVTLPKAAPISAEVDAKIGSVAWLVPDLAGPASATATLRQAGSQWALNMRALGPGGSTVQVDGQLASDAKTAALTLAGRAPLGLLNRRLAPRTLQGAADFDMRLKGPLALSSLNGDVRIGGARLSLPTLRNALGGIDATLSVANGSALVRSTATLASGGALEAEGRIGMQAPYVADIDVTVTNAFISEPKLYKTRANGVLAVRGAFASNLSVAGQLNLAETEVRVPSTGISSFGDIPAITHLGEPAAVRKTRSYAGLLSEGNDSLSSAGSDVSLDVQIVAENKIFIRGRGLDAELGGRLLLTGTTANIIPKGRFDLIRGRLDILGKRLDLQEGYVSPQGSLTPYLRLVASTSTDDYVVLVTVQGPADAPEITFSSVPELPSDEVLAQLLFGRDLTTISALQAVQLASAVATLAGRGGVGIVEKLRQKTGVDDLDITTDADGETTLRAGKYISEKVYTDVEVDSKGQSQINLNLDLSNSTKLRGSVDTEGKTGIGLFFEKDY